LLVAAAFAAFALPAAAAVPAGAPWLQPASGVFTCEWIAAHPAAAAHWLVGCGDTPVVASAIATPMTPLAPGGFSTQATLCQWIPSATTYVGNGVFTWTTYEYATSWKWTGSTLPSGGTYYYHWYLQTSGNVTYAHDQTTFGSGSVGGPGQPYRWGAQNQWVDAVHWQVCYS
jgi:hypothetical protein